jgi:hypothetical protein
VIGQAAAGTTEKAQPADDVCLFVASARTPAALRDLAAAYMDYLAPKAPGALSLSPNTCRSAALRRQNHSQILPTSSSNTLPESRSTGPAPSARLGDGSRARHSAVLDLLLRDQYPQTNGPYTTPAQRRQAPWDQPASRLAE